MDNIPKSQEKKRMKIEKRGKTVASITLLLTAILLLIITNTTGDLNCQIEESASCSGMGTILLYMQNDTGGWDNAHAENTSSATYANILCCNSTNNTLIPSCVDNGVTFLNLSAETNAHVENTSYDNYTVAACINMNTTFTNTACSVEPTGCSSDLNTTCMLSIASDSVDNMTNAHVASCGVYDTEVCCAVDSRPTVVELNEPLNYTNFSTVPEFNWNNATDVDNDDIYYILQISDNEQLFATIDYTNLSIKETDNTTEYIFTASDFTEGHYFWRVLATDMQSNATTWSETRYFTFDQTNPTITLNNPVNDSVFCNLPENQFCFSNINFTVQDYIVSIIENEDLDQVWWVNSSSSTNSSEFSYKTVTNSAYNTIAFSINVTDWPEGYVNVSVWANDSSGNEQAIQWWVFFIDQSGPSVEWVEPDPNELIHGIQNVTVTSIDNGTVNASWLRLDDVETNFSLTKDGDTDNWFYGWDTTSYADGQYTMVVYANDTTNLESNTSMRYVTIDNTAPSVTIGDASGPANNTWSKALSNTFYFSVSETNTIDNCSLIIDGNINDTKTTSEITKNTADQSFTVDLTDGRYNWTVNCTDEENNIGTDENARILNVDLSFPQFEAFDYPSENEIISRNQTINLTITDVISGVNHTWLEVKNTVGTQIDNETLSFVEGTNNYTYEWDTRLYQDDIYTITVYANDSANNENLTTRTVTVDNSGPNITLESPANDSLVGTKENTFQARVWDVSSIDNCSLIINDEINVTHTTGILNNSLQSFFTTLTTGTYNWTVNCTDAENNIGANATYWIREVDLTNPTITLIVPTDPLEFYLDNASINWSIEEENVETNYTDVTLPNGTSIDRYYDNFTLSAQDNLTLLGTYPVSTYVEDKVGHKVTADDSFTVRDTIAPNIILVSPENGSIQNSSDITFNFNVSDYHSIDNCTLWLNQTEGYTNTTMTNDITVTQNINLTNITDEENVPWNITCYDNSSNLNNTENAIRIDIDTTPPLFQFIEPTDTNNSYVSRNSTYINVSITEPHNDTAVFVWNYTTNYTSGIEAITITPGEDNIIFYEKNITNLTDGVYEYYVFSNDTLANESIGHSNVSEIRTITIDETLPTVFDLIDPSDEAELTDDTPAFNWQDSIDTNFDNYSIELSTDENLTTVNTTFSSTTESYYAMQDSEALSAGIWYWRAKAIDKANNERSSTSIFKFTISDVAKPTQYIIGPGGGGGGGGGKKIVYGVIDIIQPGMQTVYEGETIITPVIIQNTGGGPIRGVTLTTATNSPTIKLELSKAYIDFLAAEQQEEIQLKIIAKGVVGEYEITVKAEAREPTITDQAKFYVNLIGFGMGKKTILTEKLRFVGKLFESNPECLELNEIIEEAKKKLEEKDYDKSLEIIETAIKSCEELVKETQKKVLEKPAEPRKTLQILIGEILAFIFIFIMIYRYYRRRTYKGPIITKRKKQGGAMILIILIFVSGFFFLKTHTGFTVFEDVSGSDFDLGTHSNTETFEDTVRLTAGLTLGNFTSRIFNANFTVEWQTINWSWSSSANDNITMDVRTSFDNETWSSWSENVTNTSKIPDAKTIWTDMEDFVGIFTDTNITSQTGNLTLQTNCSGYNESGTFESAVLDLGFVDVNITTIEFTIANISSEDNITIETATSADNITWEDWKQTNISEDQVYSTDNKYFKWKATLVTNDTEITPVLEELTVNYERNSTYFQYRATLSTDGATPALEWVNITYQDASIPLFEFLNPTEQNDSYIANNFTYINFTISEPNNDSFYVYWNGTQYNETDMNETAWHSEGVYSYAINLTELLEGSYEYYVWANDTYGHENQTANRTITVDQTPPSSFSLLNPSDGNRSTDTNPFLLWEDSNDTNFDNYTVEFATDTSFSSVSRTYYNTSSNYQIQDSEALPSNGTFYWHVIAYDKAGQNYTTSYFTYYVGYIEETAFAPGTAGEGGGGGKAVERRQIGLEIIKPSALSFYANRQIIVPLLLVNDGTEILQGIQLTAESLHLELELKNNYFPILRTGQEIDPQLIIKPVEDPGRYNILVKAKVTEPEFTDSIMFFIDIVEFGLGNKTESQDRLTFVVDFIKSHDECAELEKFLIEADEAFKKNEFDKVLSLIEEATQGCKDLVSTAKVKKLEKKKIPKWQYYVPILEGLLFILIFSWIYSYYKRLKFKRRKHW